MRVVLVGRGDSGKSIAGNKMLLGEYFQTKLMKKVTRYILDHLNEFSYYGMYLADFSKFGIIILMMILIFLF